VSQFWGNESMIGNLGLDGVSNEKVKLIRVCIFQK